MKKYIALLFTVVLFASCTQPKPSFKQEDISLLPKPVSFELKESSFEIEANTAIVLQGENQQKAADYLIGLFDKAAGYNLELQNTITESAIFFETVEGLKKGAYSLEVNPTSITIQASEESGFFNGVQTIRQLLPVAIESKEIVDADWYVPSVSIKDEPRFEWRGMQNDFSRHFIDINEVKALLDQMALYKLNIYHMHLTDDQGWRIEIKKYPLLTEKGAWRIPNNQDTLCMERAVENKMYTIDESKFKEIDGERKYGGFFTQEQLKEIVAYADARNITVIPEIDMPGHFMSAIDNYPFLLCEGEESGFDTVFTKPACLAEDTTYEFMENILTEVAQIFPSKYIHIGGDEVNKRTWEKCPNCQALIKKEGLKDEHELQSHFNRHIEKFLQSKGKQLMGWDEIVTGGLTKDAAVMWWRGWRPEAPKMAVKNGNNLVITPTDAYYFDYLNEGNTLEKIYNYEPIPESFTEEEAKKVLGIQANLWSERIPNLDRLQYQTFPRMLAVAENAWVNQERDFEAFNTRVEKQYDRLDELGVYYYIPIVKGLDKKLGMIESAEVTLDLAYPMESVDIYYTTDGSVPTKETNKYTKPFTVNDTVEIKARAYKGDIFNDIKTTKVERKEYVAALDVSPKEKGLKRFLISGKRKKVKDVSVTKTTKWQAVDSVDIAEYKEKDPVNMVFSGYFHAEKDGVYQFETKSDGGDYLHIGETLVVDNSGWHGPRKRYGIVALKAGWHSIAITYRPSDTPRFINAWYGLQGEELQLIDSKITGY